MITTRRAEEIRAQILAAGRAACNSGLRSQVTVGRGRGEESAARTILSAENRALQGLSAQVRRRPVTGRVIVELVPAGGTP